MIEGFPNWHPPFSVVPLFDSEHCALLIRLAMDSQKFSPAMVMKQDGSTGVDSRACTARLAPFRAGTPVYDITRERIVQRLTQINEQYQFDLFDPSEAKFMPYVSVLEYSGQQAAKFEPHVDMAGRRGVEYRKLSVVVPLNSPGVYEGGRLIIDTGEKFDAFDHARRGDAVVFASTTMHGVTPVTSGLRYSLVTFLQGPRFR